jgi:hypothetical protein
VLSIQPAVPLVLLAECTNMFFWLHLWRGHCLQAIEMLSNDLIVCFTLIPFIAADFKHLTILASFEVTIKLNLFALDLFAKFMDHCIWHWEQWESLMAR